ncbi:hypothetical protein RHSP_40939 (plasmid) [Rhizobium freirei PRF 81]|uniref:Uncharacterized protein n=1 Tax=Rhizobium freirei PRF 81 TaxID=363754 RepID=N6USI5_9HYPH|nr:hypothetical protein [Rhizobium freirei]ENN83781.1 hypothetical protein RHSP_40939 [Rhizobium freirei PRF 81]
MTLIAVFNPQSPIGIADVMLSAKVPPTDGTMPNGTQFKSQEFKANAWVPYRYSQKMSILNDGKVLALGAGDFSKIKMVISDLVAALGRGLKIEELSSWLNRKAALCGKDTSVIVSWVDGTRYETIAVGNDIHALDLPATKAWHSGSGGAWFRQLPVTIGKKHFQIGEFHENEYVRMQAIAQTGFHLFNERTIGTREAFGGGFQTAYHDGNCFRMCEDVTFLLWKMVHSDDGIPVMLDLYPQIVVQRYRAPFLYFDVASLAPSDPLIGGSSYIFRGSTSIVRAGVPPLLRDSRPAVATPEPLATTPFIDNHILHLWNKKIIDISGHQLMGDVNLSDIKLAQGEDDRYEVELGLRVYDAFRSRKLSTNWKERAVDL